MLLDICPCTYSDRESSSMPKSELAVGSNCLENQVTIGGHG
jgi:hypothetical protein